MKTLLSSFLTLCLCAGASGCGDDGAETQTDGAGASGGGNAGGGGQGGMGGSGGNAEPCADDPIGPMPGTVCIQSVSGRMVDESGAGLDNISVSVCGPLNCNPATTDFDGAFTALIDFNINPTDYSTIAHARPEYVSFYFQLPDTEDADIQVGDLLVLESPATGETLTVKTDNAGAPAQSVTSNGVTLEVDDGVTIALDVEDVIQAEEGKKFRALEVPSETQDQFVDPTLGVVSLWALAPFDAEFYEEGNASELALARLTFPNTSGLAADSAVEFVALGSYLFPEWVSPAEFEPVATGVVSGDGQSISVDAGQGFNYLTWVGIRPAR